MKKCTVCGEIQNDELRTVCENCCSPLIEIKSEVKKEEKKKKEK